MRAQVSTVVYELRAPTKIRTLTLVERKYHQPEHGSLQVHTVQYGIQCESASQRPGCFALGFARKSEVAAHDRPKLPLTTQQFPPITLSGEVKHSKLEPIVHVFEASNTVHSEVRSRKSPQPRYTGLCFKRMSGDLP